MEILSPVAERVGLCVDDHVLRAEAELATLRAQLASMRAEREALRWAADHDELTGLPNRRLFNMLTPSLLDLDGQSAAVVVLDLDGFKPINDAFGHGIGDCVLHIVAQRLASWADGNPVARLGGDEFAAVITSPHPELRGPWWCSTVAALADAIAEPISMAGHTLTVTASIGVAPVHGPAPISDLLHWADLAMYHRKDQPGAGSTIAWTCGPASDNGTVHENSTVHEKSHRPNLWHCHLHGEASTATPAATPVPSPVQTPPATHGPRFLDLTVFRPTPHTGGSLPAPTCDPGRRDPADVAPADTYQPGNPVWVYRDGAWRPGAVEAASDRAVTARYRCAEGLGTVVDTMWAQYVAARANPDPHLDRNPLAPERAA